MLDSLIRKAIGDAGFDLEPAREGEWWRLGVSGTPGAAWVRPAGGGALLALPLVSQLAELDVPRAPNDAPTPPPGAAGAVACAGPRTLYFMLRRVRVLLAESPPRLVERLQARIAAVTSTETQAVVRQRVGQELFREALLAYWEGKCAVTGLAVPELLRASHAKPWKDASDAERLDVHNGLLLAVHLDALFDRGLLTFGEDGRGVASPRLPAGTMSLLGLGSVALTLRFVRPAHLPYLAYHREHVFRAS